MNKNKNTLIIAISVIVSLVMIMATVLFIVNYTTSLPQKNTATSVSDNTEADVQQNGEKDNDKESDKEQENKSEYIEASESDFDAIAEILSGLMYLEPEYNKANESGPVNVMARLMNPIFDVYSYYDKIYGWNSVDDTYIGFEMSPDKNGWIAGDPLKKFTELYACRKFDAEKIDWIVKNAFGFEPQHDNLSGDVFGDAYYYEGYYYVGSGDGGDITYDAKVTDSTRLEDGSYKLSLAVGYPGQLYMSFEAVAALKNVDGENCWYIISYRPL